MKCSKRTIKSSQRVWRWAIFLYISIGFSFIFFPPQLVLPFFVSTSIDFPLFCCNKFGFPYMIVPYVVLSLIVLPLFDFPISPLFAFPYLVLPLFSFHLFCFHLNWFLLIPSLQSTVFQCQTVYLKIYKSFKNKMYKLMVR